MATVLIVDDRPTNRHFLVTLLGYGGHRLLEASDGAEALELTLAERPDLVITDILMPTMDGYEFVQRIRREKDIAATPVIFYSSAFSVPEAEAMGRNCGVRTVLAKPSDPEVILKAVNVELGLDHGQGSPNAPLALGGTPAIPAASTRVGDPLVEGDPISGLQSVIARLGALEQLSLRLVKERRPGPMVQLFVEAAASILGARQAAVCVLDAREEAVAYLATKDMDGGLLRAAALDRERLPGSLLVARAPVRLDREAGKALPEGFKAAGGFLGVSIVSRGQLHGWMCFSEKARGAPFDSDDERVALSMAAQLAVVYENSVLYQTVQRHAALLQLAVSAREHAGRELKESEERFRQLAENIPEVFFLTDATTTKMLYVSPAYAEIWGMSRESLYERPQSWAESVHPEDRERAYAVFAELATSGRCDFEYRILRPDGDIRWIRARAFPILDEGGVLSRIAGLAADVTDRKKDEINLVRMNRALRMLSSCNDSLIRAEEEDALLQNICRIAVEIGGYRIARVGLILDGPDQTVLLKAHAGEIPDFLRSQLVSASADRPEGQGPIGRAIRSRKPIIIDRLADEPSLISIAGQLEEARLGPSIYLPLEGPKFTKGILILHSAEGSRTNEDELALLQELANDLAFGISTIRGRAARQKADEALQASLREKEALLKEVHHRVKNNMQVITSLLRLESNRIEHTGTRAVLKDMQNRILAMAVLHEGLYKTGNFAQVDLRSYLGQLISQLGRSLIVSPDVIAFHLDLAPVGLDLDQAIPCGLIVNELVSNSLKHAFPAGRPGGVWVELQDVDKRDLRLRVRDDGVGLPADFEDRRGKSLGLQLVSDLARQLRGSLRTGPGPSASFEVIFTPDHGGSRV